VIITKGEIFTYFKRETAQKQTKDKLQLVQIQKSGSGISAGLDELGSSAPSFQRLPPRRRILWLTTIGTGSNSLKPLLEPLLAIW
jgi:hypothetical protein